MLTAVTQSRPDDQGRLVNDSFENRGHTKVKAGGAARCRLDAMRSRGKEATESSCEASVFPGEATKSGNRAVNPRTVRSSLPPAEESVQAGKDLQNIGNCPLMGSIPPKRPRSASGDRRDGCTAYVPGPPTAGPSPEEMLRPCRVSVSWCRPRTRGFPLVGVQQDSSRSSQREWASLSQDAGTAWRFSRFSALTSSAITTRAGTTTSTHRSPIFSQPQSS